MKKLFTRIGSLSPRTSRSRTKSFMTARILRISVTVPVRFSASGTGWLGREDSNLDMAISKWDPLALFERRYRTPFNWNS